MIKFDWKFNHNNACNICGRLHAGDSIQAGKCKLRALNHFEGDEKALMEEFNRAHTDWLWANPRPQAPANRTEFEDIRVNAGAAKEKRPCAICLNPIGHPQHPHVVFCSSTCARAAAKAAKAADRALRFITGLNLQDHSVKEQQESLVIVRQLMHALKPEKAKK